MTTACFSYDIESCGGCDFKWSVNITTRAELVIQNFPHDLMCTDL